MATEDDVRRIALSLPECHERPSYGTPGFRVADRLFARLRDDGESLVVWVADEGEKQALVQSEPDKFFTTPHYDGHPSVLVRCAVVGTEQLTELLTEAWRVRAPARVLSQHADQLPGSAVGHGSGDREHEDPHD
jgi:hypothetical protein